MSERNRDRARRGIVRVIYFFLVCSYDHHSSLKHGTNANFSSYHELLITFLLVKEKPSVIYSRTSTVCLLTAVRGTYSASTAVEHGRHCGRLPTTEGKKNKTKILLKGKVLRTAKATQQNCTGQGHIIYPQKDMLSLTFRSLTQKQLSPLLRVGGWEDGRMGGWVGRRRMG